MDRRAITIVLIASLTGLLFAAVTTAGGVGLWTEPQWEPAQRSPDPVEIDADDGEIEASEEQQDDGDPIDPPGWLSAVLNVLGIVAIFLGLAWLLRAGWNRRANIRWGRPPTGPLDFEVLPDVATALADEADAHRAALQRGTPRNAIVQCWVRLEQDVAAAGLTRDPADTSAEFTERVLADYSLDPAAIRELGSLYREARFSDHPLDEDARAAALHALDRLHLELRAAASSPADAAPLDAQRIGGDS